MTAFYSASRQRRRIRSVFGAIGVERIVHHHARAMRLELMWRIVEAILDSQPLDNRLLRIIVQRLGCEILHFIPERHTDALTRSVYNKSPFG